MKSRVLPILRWVLTILVATGFLLAGIPKVLSVDVWKMKFTAWGYSSEFLILIGALEIAGAILFLIPRTMLLGLLTLGTICVGAAYTHFMDNGLVEQWRPALYLALMLAALWARRSAKPSPPVP